MTKAARIRELLATGLSTREVAEQVGCDPAYVRVAGRQRRDGKTSHIDRAYRASPKGVNARREYFKRRYHNDPEFRRRVIDEAMRRDRANPEAARARCARYRARLALEAASNRL